MGLFRFSAAIASGGLISPRSTRAKSLTAQRQSLKVQKQMLELQKQQARRR